MKDYIQCIWQHELSLQVGWLKAKESKSYVLEIPFPTPLVELDFSLVILKATCIKMPNYIGPSIQKHSVAIQGLGVGISASLYLEL